MTFWPVLLLVSACDPAPALEGKRSFDQGKFAEVQFRRALEQSCDAAQRFADRINLAATLRERHAAAEARSVLIAAPDPAQMPVDMQIAYWNCLWRAFDPSGCRLSEGSGVVDTGRAAAFNNANLDERGAPAHEAGTPAGSGGGAATARLAA